MLTKKLGLVGLNGKERAGYFNFEFFFSNVFPFCFSLLRNCAYNVEHTNPSEIVCFCFCKICKILLKKRSI